MSKYFRDFTAVEWMFYQQLLIVFDGIDTLEELNDFIPLIDEVMAIKMQLAIKATTFNDTYQAEMNAKQQATDVDNACKALTDALSI